MNVEIPRTDRELSRILSEQIPRTDKDSTSLPEVEIPRADRDISSASSEGSPAASIAEGVVTALRQTQVSEDNARPHPMPVPKCLFNAALLDDEFVAPDPLLWPALPQTKPTGSTENSSAEERPPQSTEVSAKVDEPAAPETPRSRSQSLPSVGGKTPAAPLLLHRQPSLKQKSDKMLRDMERMNIHKLPLPPAANGTTAKRVADTSPGGNRQHRKQKSSSSISSHSRK